MWALLFFVRGGWIWGGNKLLWEGEFKAIEHIALTSGEMGFCVCHACHMPLLVVVLRVNAVVLVIVKCLAYSKWNGMLIEQCEETYLVCIKVWLPSKEDFECMLFVLVYTIWY